MEVLQPSTRSSKMTYFKGRLPKYLATPGVWRSTRHDSLILSPACWDSRSRPRRPTNLCLDVPSSRMFMHCFRERGPFVAKGEARTILVARYSFSALLLACQQNVHRELVQRACSLCKIGLHDEYVGQHVVTNTNTRLAVKMFEGTGSNVCDQVSITLDDIIGAICVVEVSLV